MNMWMWIWYGRGSGIYMTTKRQQYGDNRVIYFIWKQKIIHDHLLFCIFCILCSMSQKTTESTTDNIQKFYVYMNSDGKNSNIERAWRMRPLVVNNQIKLAFAHITVADFFIASRANYLRLCCFIVRIFYGWWLHVLINERKMFYFANKKR